MTILLKYIFIVTILTSFVYGEIKQNITLAPLPIKNTASSIQDFLPLQTYLEENLNTSVKCIHKNSYQDIINAFKNGQIDIAYLGPLPFKALEQQYSHIKPIASIKQNNGTSSYRCVLTKFKNDPIDTSKPIKVALTQPLSTCGFYMTDSLLKEKLGVNLKKQKFKYLMSHSNAILSVLDGENIIAGVKDTVASQYATVGMEVVAQSKPLPGFVLVANTKTLTQKDIMKIQNSLLNIDSKTYSTWKGIFSKGFIEVDMNQYNTFEVDFNDIPLEGNM